MRDLTRAGPADWTPAIFAGFALAETAGLAAAAQGLATWPILLAGHGLCLALAAVALRATPAADLTFAVLGFLLCISTGPVGASGAIVLRLIVRRTRVGAQELAAWYHRLAGMAQAEASVGLYESILDGRARRPTNGVVDHFPAALDGHLPEQQAVLGLIGLAWHPDYKPILAQALCSAEPSIRVHAAAVSVKLRARTLASLKQAQEAMAAGPKDPAALAATFLDLADGGFLDDAKARSAREDALGLCRRALAQDPDHPRAGALLRRVLVDLGCPEGTRAALAHPGPAADRRDRAVRLRGLMALGDAQGLHALLVMPGPERCRASNDAAFSLPPLRGKVAPDGGWERGGTRRATWEARHAH